LLFVCIILINAFNYFDGIDGMLGCTSISVIAILYFLATKQNSHFLVSEQNIQFFLLIIFIPIVIFLCFNFSFLILPKLFLGDSGSLLMGFIISFILIYFAKQNFIHPILLAWSVVIFVYEFLSINIIRLKNNQELFMAGQDHLHHILYKKNKSILLTNLLISLLNIVFFTVGYLSFIFINPVSSLIFFITFFVLFLIIRNKYSIKITKIKAN
jgi:UDP-N-acetylmuramyl pentapeptide phosphotransferase/UDP-N-acetylglucosamine-1-phosphate transferase